MSDSTQDTLTMEELFPGSVADAAIEPPTIQSEITQDNAIVPQTPIKKKRPLAAGVNEDVTSPKKPRTPSSKTKASAKKATPEKLEDQDGDGDQSIETPTASAKKGRASKAGGISKTLEEASIQDRLLYEMKQANKPKAEIDAMWEKHTGIKPGKSTLGNRYIRLMDNFARLADGDDQKLLDAEQKWEKGKFQIISELMAKNGCQNYSLGLITKEYKRIKDAQAKGVFFPTEAPVPAFSDNTAEANMHNNNSGDEGSNSGDGAEIKAEVMDNGDLGA